MIRKLRYVLDVIAMRFDPYCPADWLDLHFCARCKRIARRKRRIADYREARQFPLARLRAP